MNLPVSLKAAQEPPVLVPPFLYGKPTTLFIPQRSFGSIVFNSL